MNTSTPLSALLHVHPLAVRLRAEGGQQCASSSSSPSSSALPHPGELDAGQDGIGFPLLSGRNWCARISKYGSIDISSGGSRAPWHPGTTLRILAEVTLGSRSEVVGQVKGFLVETLSHVFHVYVRVKKEGGGCAQELFCAFFPSELGFFFFFCVISPPHTHTQTRRTALCVFTVLYSWQQRKTVTWGGGDLWSKSHI